MSKGTNSCILEQLSCSACWGGGERQDSGLCRLPQKCVTYYPTLKRLTVKNLDLCAFLPKFQELPLPV